MTGKEDEQFEKDDALDNMLEEDGEDHFLYGNVKKPDHQPGPRSGCFGIIVLLIVPATLAGWYLMKS